MNTQPITIQTQVFDCPMPYSAGHTLTENEAMALNNLLSENLRNNFAGKMKKAETPLGQADFDAYAAGYVFGQRAVSTGAKSVRDPVEKEERALAKEAILASYAKKGIKPRSVPTDTLEAYITRLVESGNLRAMAEENVARAASLPTFDLDIPEEGTEASEAAPAPKQKREKKAA